VFSRKFNEITAFPKVKSGFWRIINLDRTFRGLIAGVIASVFMNAWNLMDYYFINFTNLRFLDWVAVIASGTKPSSNFEVIVDLVIAFIWDGALGVIFAHLLTKITSRGVIIKATIYSALLWFIFHGIAVFYRLTPILEGQTFPGRFSNFLSSILWGIILGWILKKLDTIPEKIS
jgi:hypothetical protein